MEGLVHNSFGLEELENTDSERVFHHDADGRLRTIVFTDLNNIEGAIEEVVAANEERQGHDIDDPKVSARINS